jgi:hypothetical protein
MRGVRPRPGGQLAKSYASILSFPFRVYGESFLPKLEAETQDCAHRVRVYPPWRSREKGSPISPLVPFTSWASFSWHPSVPPELRLAPPADIHLQPFGDRAYDSMRIDAYGDDAEAWTHDFALRFLSWLRHLTYQSWIGRVEADTDPLIKAGFPISPDGSATERPYAFGVGVTSDGNRHALTSPEWRRAFDRSVAGLDPPTHWALWMDAENDYMQGHLNETVLLTALAAEVARDTLLAPLTPSARATVAGPRLGPPFQGTDLLQHLSDNLEVIKGHNLQKARPDVYATIDSLYVARHHVAHGKRPIVREPRGTRLATMADAESWLSAGREVLVWLHEVTGVAI